MKPRVLIIEDSATVVASFKNYFSELNYELACVGSLSGARQLLERQAFDLIILALSLPDGNGNHFLAEVFSNYNLKEIPVIMISTNSEVEHKVIAFANGAEDFLVQPLNMIEVKARVDAKLMKGIRKNKSQFLRKGPLEINLATQKAYLIIDKNVLARKELDLTSREFKILIKFVKSDGIVLSRESMLDDIWGDKLNVSDRVVDVHISNLRKKLGAFAYMIKSIPREGYQFEIPKERLAS